MKNTLFFLLSALLVSCTPKSGQQMVTQNINQEVLDIDGEPILLGMIDRAGLMRENYRSWFQTSYDNHQPDPAVLEDMRGRMADKQFVIFLGTWCTDSHREVPHFFKIADALGIAESQIQMYAVTNDPQKYRTTPQGYENGWDIELVPTIIMLQDGQELGRIVEASYPSLVENLRDMLP